MSATGLYTAITAGGILNINFVNGRLLTAEDLSGLQTANAQQHQQLARATGEGVAYGFEVSLAPSSSPRSPIVRVTRGLAFNRKGNAAALATDYVDVALVKSADVQRTSTGFFAECPPPQPLLQNTNLGLYVLTVMPASTLQGSVSVVDFNSSGMASSCSSRFAAEGVQFQLDPLQIGSGDATSVRGQLSALAQTLEPELATLANLSGAAQNQFAIQIAPQLSLFRNLAAHLCFGTETLAAFPAEIFPGAGGTPFPVGYSALDDMRTAGLITDCEIPLALVYWTSSGLVFLDAWAVRRTVTQPHASIKWAPFVNARRAREALAIFLQFQDHISGLLSALPTASLIGAVATDYFRFLPPLGFLPLSSAAGSGFSLPVFFAGRTVGDPVYVEGSREEFLVLRSLAYSPIDFASQEMIWLYWVRENREEIDSLGNQGPLPYLVFTNGQLRFQGEANFDLNYWDYANYV
jgi:hypothetical protein